MVKTLIVLTVSRADYLDPVFLSLELLTCDRETTGLLVYVDGDSDLFAMAKTYCDASKFKEPRAVHRNDPKSVVEYDLLARRHRIAAIHNELKALLGKCRYVFCVEDDTIVPPYALERLQRTHGLHPYCGFVSGIQLGRHGLPHVGAWSADSVYEPTSLTSLMPPAKPEVQEVDAAGWFCYLATRDVFVSHEYKPFETALGPDVEFGLAMRQEGRRNYVDWSVWCEHRSGDTSIEKVPRQVMRAMVFRSGREWKLSVRS